MKIFRCDICFKPFSPGEIASINTIEFLNSNIDDSVTYRTVNTLNNGLPDNVSNWTAFYHICPDCINALRTTLWSLRNNSKENDQNE